MRTLRLAVMLWLAAALSAGALGAEVTPLGQPIRVDAGAACHEQVPDVAGQPDGGFVTVWSQEGRVLLRRFDAAGRAVGEEVGAAPFAGPQTQPAVSADGQGRFVVAWYEDSVNAVRARRFSPTGVPLGDPFTVATQVGLDGGIDVAAAQDGAFAVTWAHFDTIWARAFTPEGAPLGQVADAVVNGGIVGPVPRFVFPALAAIGPRDYALAYSQLSVGIFNFFFTFGRRLHFGPQGVLDSRDLDLVPDALASGADVAASPDGFVVVWHQILFGEPQIVARRFDASGTPIGKGNVRVDDGTSNEPGRPAVALNQAGEAVVLWPAFRPNSEQSPIFARSLDVSGALVGPLIELAPANEVLGVAAARTGELGVAAVWQEQEDPNALDSTCQSRGLFARRLATSCAAGPGQLCLLNGRFRAEVAWEDPVHAQTGAGHAVGLTDQSGYFWFFGESNVELMVKVIDGRGVNDKFWVFFGGLSNVPYTLTVTDTATNQVRQYQNKRFELASKADTAAFPGGTEGLAARASTDDGDLKAPTPARASSDAADLFGLGPSTSFVQVAAPAFESAAGPCSDPSLPVVPRAGLCLANRSFEVEVEWRDPVHGTTGKGVGVPLTDDSGYFWFFSPGNVELVFKVVDGRPVNGRFWVFSGALTNVEYTLRVRHASGVEREYHNPPFQLRSFADTGAFSVPAD